MHRFYKYLMVIIAVIGLMTLTSVSFAQDKSKDISDSGEVAVAKSQEQIEAEAETEFKALEKEYRKFLRIKIVPDKNVKAKDIDKYLQTQLSFKAKQMELLLPKYSRIITTYNSPEWGLASMTRMGMMYQSIADELIEFINSSAIDKMKLQDDVREVFVSTIKDFASKFNEKAVSFYESIEVKAQEYSLKTKFTEEAHTRLEKIRQAEQNNAADSAPSQTSEQ